MNPNSKKSPKRSRGTTKSKVKCPVGTKVVLNPRDWAHRDILQQLIGWGKGMSTDRDDVAAEVVSVLRGPGGHREVRCSWTEDSERYAFRLKIKASSLLGADAAKAAKEAHAASLERRKAKEEAKVRAAAVDILKEIAETAEGCVLKVVRSPGAVEFLPKYLRCVAAATQFIVGIYPDLDMTKGGSSYYDQIRLLQALLDRPVGISPEIYEDAQYVFSSLACRNQHASFDWWKLWNKHEYAC